MQQIPCRVRPHGSNPSGHERQLVLPVLGLTSKVTDGCCLFVKTFSGNMDAQPERKQGVGP